MKPGQKTRGIKCTTCNAELSHVVSDKPELEAMMVQGEEDAKIQHRGECPNASFVDTVGTT